MDDPSFVPPPSALSRLIKSLEQIVSDQIELKQNTLTARLRAANISFDQIRGKSLRGFHLSPQECEQLKNKNVDLRDCTFENPDSIPSGCWIGPDTLPSGVNSVGAGTASIIHSRWGLVYVLYGSKLYSNCYMEEKDEIAEVATSLEGGWILKVSEYKSVFISRYGMIHAFYALDIEKRKDGSEVISTRNDGTTHLEDVVRPLYHDKGLDLKARLGSTNKALVADAVAIADRSFNGGISSLGCLILLSDGTMVYLPFPHTLGSRDDWGSRDLSPRILKVERFKEASKSFGAFSDHHVNLQCDAENNTYVRVSSGTRMQPTMIFELRYDRLVHVAQIERPDVRIGAFPSSTGHDSLGRERFYDVFGSEAGTWDNGKLWYSSSNRDLLSGDVPFFVGGANVVSVEHFSQSELGVFDDWGRCSIWKIDSENEIIKLTSWLKTDGSFCFHGGRIGRGASFLVVRGQRLHSIPLVR